MGRRHSRQRVNPPPPSGLEACRIQAEVLDLQSAEFCKSSDKNQSSARPPLSPAHSVSTRFPLGVRSAFCLHHLYFTIDRASEVLKTLILDASGPRSLKHYANYALRELRIRNLDTSGPRSSYITRNMLKKIRIGIMNTPGRYVFVSFSRQSIHSTKFKQINPQDDDSYGAAVTRRRRPHLQEQDTRHLT